MSTLLASTIAESETTPVAAFRLGTIHVQPDIGRLQHGDDRETHLEPRVMDLLVFLSARPGEVLTKEALRESVWRGRFVTQDALFVAISALRRALGDEPRAARFIATVPKRGYRWIGPVPETVEEEAPRTVAVAQFPASGKETRGEQAQGQPLTEPTHLSNSRRRGYGPVGVGIALIAIAALTLWAMAPKGESRGAETPDRAISAITEAKHFAEQATNEGFRKAIGAYSEAIALAPNLGSAYAGLADTYAQMVDHGFGTPRDFGTAARANARRAVELDPDGAASHMAEGSVRMLFDHDFEGAAASYRRALEIDPDSTPALERLAWNLAALGDQEGAERAVRRALTIDPTARPLHTALVTILYFARQSDALDIAAENALRIDSDLCLAHFYRSQAHRWRGRDDRAFVAYRHGLQCSTFPPVALEAAGQAFENGGMPAVDQWLFSRTKNQPPGAGLQAASIAAIAGEVDYALDLLEQAEQRMEPALYWMHVNPSLESLHETARYQQLKQRLTSTRPAR